MNLLALAFVSAIVRPGWDFSLPETVKPDPYAGLVWMDNKPQSPEIIHEGRTLTWAQLNPGEGVYDFNLVTKILDAAQGQELGLGGVSVLA